MTVVVKKVDYITFFYLSIPILIFFLGWFKIYYGVLFSALLIVGVFKFLENTGNQSNLPPNFTFNRWSLFASVIAFGWVYSSGIGGFANQDWDHHFRNALFRDLIQENWPVYYSFPVNYKIQELAGSESALNYYLTYWLPSAILGKFWNKNVADILLLIWSYTGILLTFYYLNRLFSFKYIFVTSMLFMLWSGMDILGKIVLEKHMLYPEEVIDVYYHFFYTAFTTDLFNVFNQAIPTWLITLWVLNNRREINIIPITLLIAYAPFPFIGLVVLHGLVYTLEYFQVSKGRIKGFTNCLLDEILQFKTIAIIIGVLLPYGLFYSAHTSDVPSSLFWDRFPEATLVKSIKSFIAYFFTYFFEVGIYLIIVYTFSRKVYRENKIVFWVCCLLLLVMPILVIGQFGDFASRGSIPLLTVLCVLTVKAIINYYETKNVTYKGVFIAIVLLLSWITPTIAFVRSIPVNGSPKLREAIITYSNPAISKQKDKQNVYSSLMNFYSYDPKRYIFYKYLAKN